MQTEIKFRLFKYLFNVRCVRLTKLDKTIKQNRLLKDIIQLLWLEDGYLYTYGKQTEQMTHTCQPLQVVSPLLVA